jgi:hypothetical protein
VPLVGSSCTDAQALSKGSYELYETFMADQRISTMDIVLEIVSEIVFEICVHAIRALWKSSRFFRIAVGIIALIGVLVVARVVHFP